MCAIQTAHKMNCLAFSLVDNTSTDTGLSVTSLNMSNYSVRFASKRACCFCVKGSLDVTSNQQKN